jgi:putative NADH-flavin reductase
MVRGQRLLILGATGPTGRLVVTQALANGYDVTAFARRPDALPERQKVRVIQGDVTKDAGAFAEALAGQQAVISALGRGRQFRSHGLIEKSVKTIVPAMERLGPERLIFTSALGVGATASDAPLLPRLFFTTLLRDIYADKAAGEVLIRGSRLAWTIAYPAKLTDGPATGKYTAGERPALPWFPQISRADLAAFLLRCVDDQGSVRRGLQLFG